METTLNQIITEYETRYKNDAYMGPQLSAESRQETENLFKLLYAARKLSPAAQSEFLRVFDYEFALDGCLPFWGASRFQYPHLDREADATGIQLNRNRR